VEAKGKLLIVDDELIVRDSLEKWFREEGYEVTTADSASAALTLLAGNHWDVVLVDIKMPGTDGITLQRHIRDIEPALITIIMTGYASVETAVQALKNGAYDYVTKPFDPDEISHLIRNAMAHRRAVRENLQLREQVAHLAPAAASAGRPWGIVGQSAAIRRVLDAVETVGPTEATVLITGESGTGKEVVARAIHAASPRRFQPLVPLHCGALTETLLESELFGHEKGAFTGAQYRKKGKFELAEGGTVFLDEIGDISLKTQTDLLRVLQEREITRVGGAQPIKVDFRCIAATNRPLDVLIKEGHFRPDLYYRLNVFYIEMPALRERRDDIPLLAVHFVTRFAQSMNKRMAGLTPEVLALLQQHSWPGNVRELENAIERAMVVARPPELVPQDFTLRVQPAAEPAQALAEVERAHILRVLEECGGNQTRAAELLGIDRVTLYHKLKRYGWKRVTVEVHQ
jgi:DNA-binding NtrC family response regulator